VYASKALLQPVIRFANTFIIVHHLVCSFHFGVLARKTHGFALRDKATLFHVIVLIFMAIELATPLWMMFTL
jgi:hypothetical protein